MPDAPLSALPLMLTIGAGQPDGHGLLTLTYPFFPSQARAQEQRAEAAEQAAARSMQHLEQARGDQAAHVASLEQQVSGS